MAFHTLQQEEEHAKFAIKRTMSVVAVRGYLRNLLPVTLRCISSRRANVDGPGRPSFLFSVNSKDLDWKYESDVKPPIAVPSPYTFRILLVTNYVNNMIETSKDPNRVIYYSDRFILQSVQNQNFYITALFGSDIVGCDCTVVPGSTNRVILDQLFQGNADNARQIWTAQRCAGTIAPDSQNRILIGEIMNIVSNRGRPLNLGNCVCNYGGYDCTEPTKRLQFYPPNGLESWIIPRPDCPNGRVINGTCIPGEGGKKGILPAVWIGIGVGGFLLLVLIGITIWLVSRRKPAQSQLIPIIITDQVSDGL